VRSILILMSIVGVIFCGSANALQWPNGARSAVSITADDGWPTELIQAQILESYGFRGTFYLTVQGLPIVETDKASWRSVFQRGHEVGNHTYSHWSDQTLAGKTWLDVATDVSIMESWLYTNIYSDTYTDHTFAYPQGNYVIGSQASTQSKQVGACEYAALLSAVMPAARVVGGAANDPAQFAARRFYFTGQSIDGPDASAVASAKDAIDAGIANGTWTVLVFHSLGDVGDGYSVSQAAYTQIINYMYQRRADLWVQPVVAVKNYINANIAPVDWTCKLP
jgi:peptidoglycan/xylan/chitin deacetylase (PgdA/CDA1 family)